jgi:2,3-bisphosphoglycerate-dependent phosphoglycerate mutase
VTGVPGAPRAGAATPRSGAVESRPGAVQSPAGAVETTTGTALPRTSTATPRAGTAIEQLTLLLVRHAEPVPPTSGGPREPVRPLTAHGRRQAEELAEALRAEEPHAIVSSPYLRAVQTVQPAADRLGLGVELLADLREWRAGLEPTPNSKDHYLRCWSNPGYALPGAESHRHARQRMLAALSGMVARWLPRGGTVVAGSHGTVITLALAGIGAPVDADFWLGMPVPAVYRLGVDAQGAWSSVSGPGLPVGWSPAGRR